jgi:hypothetical protein
MHHRFIAREAHWQEDIGKDPRYSVTTGISAAAELRIEIELLPAHHFLTVGDLLCTINVGRSTGGSSKCMYSDKFPEVSIGVLGDGHKLGHSGTYLGTENYI